MQEEKEARLYSGNLEVPEDGKHACRALTTADDEQRGGEDKARARPRPHAHS